MLVLSRKRDEGIQIGDNIRLVVIEIRGDKVKLGVQAPGEIPVHRDEVAKKIEADKCRNSGRPPAGVAAPVVVPAIVSASLAMASAAVA